MASASRMSRRPISGSPASRISLSASVAWIVPMIPGSDAEHAALGAARDEAGRRRLGVEAAVAGPVLGREHRGLALEPEDAAVDVGPPGQHAGVVHQVARREVVGAVDHHVVAREDLERVRRRQRDLVGLDADLRVDRARAARAPTRPWAGRRRASCAGSGAAGCCSRRRRSRRCRSCRRRPRRGTSRPASPDRRRRRTAPSPP